MQISLFMKGITNDCRRMINASTGGNYLNKTTTQVKTIIKDLATSERTIDTNWSNLPKGMYELNAQDNLLALQQKIEMVIEAMTKAIQQIPQQLQGAISKKPQQVFTCEECKGCHQISKCTKVQTEEVNYMGGQQQPYNNFQQIGFQNIHGNYNQVRDNTPQ